MMAAHCLVGLHSPIGFLFCSYWIYLPYKAWKSLLSYRVSHFPKLLQKQEKKENVKLNIWMSCTFNSVANGLSYLFWIILTIIVALNLSMDGYVLTTFIILVHLIVNIWAWFCYNLLLAEVQFSSFF